MKRRPMLFSKILSKTNSRGREVIGLIGTHHGVGVTYTGLMLAFYMGEILCKKTAFLECNDHHDMELIRNAYKWQRDEGNSFSFQQIYCYPEVRSQQIVNMIGEDFECLILDFGINHRAYLEEFLRCTTKIVIGGRSEWDKQKLERFIEDSKTLRGSDSWLYFIPQADDKAVTKISNEIKRKVWAVPRIEEPTITNQSSNKFFDKLF